MKQNKIGWQVKSLGDICSITTGDKDVNEGDVKGQYPFFTCAAEPLTSASFSFEGEAILLPGNGANVGLALYYDGKFEAYQRTYVLNNFSANVKYVYFHLRDRWKKSQTNKQYGSATNYIRYDNIASYKIPLPPLPIQKQIAEILEKADKAKQKRKDANKLTDEFLQSLFIEMFGDPVKNPKGWEVGALNAIARIERDSIASENLSTDDLYIGLEHIEKETGRLLGFQRVGDIDLKSNKFKFTASHILYGKLRPYLNKVCLPNFSGVCSTDIIPIQPIKNKCDKYFLAYLMKQDFFVQEATSKSTGANLPRISPNILASFKIISPPLKHQRGFAEIVNKTETLKEKQKQSEQELENLFQSLMQRAFKGEIEFATPVYTIPAVSKQKLSSTDLHAGIIAKIIKAHSQKPVYSKTLGHVKTEKICHIIESHLEIDLGRNPKRIAAGPADFPHLQKVEHRAKMKNWFTVLKRENENGYKYKTGKSFDYLLQDTSTALAEAENSVDETIMKFVNLRTEHAEVIATVYAAWNDLLIEGKNLTDDKIVIEARGNWSPEKLKIKEENFYKSIEWLRRKNLIPRGKGKHTIKNNQNRN